jgi:hypothetical protein
MAPYFTHVVGTKPDQQIVIEGTSYSFRKRKPMPGKPLIQTNHFVHMAR